LWRFDGRNRCRPRCDALRDAPGDPDAVQVRAAMRHVSGARCCPRAILFSAPRLPHSKSPGAFDHLCPGGGGRFSGPARPASRWPIGWPVRWPLTLAPEAAIRSLFAPASRSAWARLATAAGVGSEGGATPVRQWSGAPGAGPDRGRSPFADHLTVQPAVAGITPLSSPSCCSFCSSHWP
jgi:hypothetical protein